MADLCETCSSLLVPVERRVVSDTPYMVFACEQCNKKIVRQVATR